MQVILPHSELIKSAEYVGDTLTLEFARGGKYQYDNVPSLIVAALTVSDSAGSFFSRFIRNKFPYHKIAE
jgi:hypothetical protein